MLTSNLLDEHELISVDRGQNCRPGIGLLRRTTTLTVSGLVIPSNVKSPEMRTVRKSIFSTEFETKSMIGYRAASRNAIRNAALERPELALRARIANRADRKRDLGASRIDFPVRRRGGLRRRQREYSDREHCGKISCEPAAVRHNVGSERFTRTRVLGSPGRRTFEFPEFKLAFPACAPVLRPAPPAFGQSPDNRARPGTTRRVTNCDGLRAHRRVRCSVSDDAEEDRRAVRVDIGDFAQWRSLVGEEIRGPKRRPGSDTFSAVKAALTRSATTVSFLAWKSLSGFGSAKVSFV
jgi:hypothetical protein